MEQPRHLLTLRYSVSLMEVNRHSLQVPVLILKSRVNTGLLCVTCTDLPVLATTNFPEKWSVVTLCYSPSED